MEGQKRQYCPGKKPRTFPAAIVEKAGANALAKRSHPTETPYHTLNLCSLPRLPGPCALLATPLPQYDYFAIALTTPGTNPRLCNYAWASAGAIDLALALLARQGLPRRGSWPGLGPAPAWH